MGVFPMAERAFQLAELIALELGIEVDAKWRGWTVEVRSAQGQKLFAVPVGGADGSRSNDLPFAADGHGISTVPQTLAQDVGVGSAPHLFV
jgi:hypothetical protein